jgi:hypothetical protein
MKRRDRSSVTEPGASVYVRNYGQGDRWLPGLVTEQRTARSVIVSTDKGLMHRHPDQLQQANGATALPGCVTGTDEDTLNELPVAQHQQQLQLDPVRRASTRPHHPPARLNL